MDFCRKDERDRGGGGPRRGTAAAASAAAAGAGRLRAAGTGPRPRDQLWLDGCLKSSREGDTLLPWAWKAAGQAS